MSVAAIPYGGRAVLENVAAQRSLWHGWENGHGARTLEGQDAYQERARAISALRMRGFLTEDGLLTDLGAAAVKAMVATRG